MYPWTLWLNWWANWLTVAQPRARLPARQPPPVVLPTAPRPIRRDNVIRVDFRKTA